MIAEVVVEERTSVGKDSFSYSISENLRAKIKVGSIVSVGFGKKKLRGVVINVGKDPKNANYTIKPVDSVDGNFSLPTSYIDLSKWISGYYLCSLGEAISLFLPPTIANPRDVPEKKPAGRETIHKLNNEQLEIFENLAKKLKSARKKPALLFGVTGSGKTEIYLHLARETIRQKKQVVVLVPEIILTPQTVERFEQIFGDDTCLIHSGLSVSEKYHCYKAFSKGEKSIIIGPRSALLVPSENIGLIIVDEEQEDAYKQDQNPRYNAIDLAEKIAAANNALLILGSATPRTETFFKAKTGIYEIMTMKNRHQKLILPPAEVIDLKNEIRSGNNSPISEKLKLAVEETLKNHRQVLLFLNRRGQNTFVSCRECGEIILCPNCNIPLIFYLYPSPRMRCHHCDFSAQPPAKCPKCGGAKIKFFGSGVERIESEIKKLFPKAKIKRVDSETIRNKNDYEKFYSDLKNHKIDIALGTQMLSKGFDIPGIDLVGIISADVGLHLPHFRASEKTFRILTQVSGRSGRGENSGKTVIQTYWPNSRAILAASKHDYNEFYRLEIGHREELNYPPFSHLVRVVVEDKNESKAKKEIEAIAEELKQGDFTFIGPAKSFYEKLRNRFRYHLIIKVESLPDKKLTEIYSKFPYATWDVDPYEML